MKLYYGALSMMLFASVGTQCATYQTASNCMNFPNNRTPSPESMVYIPTQSSETSPLLQETSAFSHCQACWNHPCTNIVSRILLALGLVGLLLVATEMVVK